MNINKSDIIWSYLSKFFSLGVNIILLPLIMSYLTDTELGLWYVFASISQIVSLFDFGFNATLSRHMTYAWSGARNLKKVNVGDLSGDEHNVHLMAVVIATCRSVYFIISFVAIIVMLTLGSLYIYEVLDHNFTSIYKYSWVIYSLAVFMNLFYGYWSSLLQGIGAVAERNKMNVYSKIIQLILAFILLFWGLGLFGFVIAYTVSGVSLRFIGKAYFVKKTIHIGLSTKINSTEIKECFGTVWYTAWKDGLVMLAQYLSTQANTLICAYFIDLGATSSYGVITQIAAVLASVGTAYFSAYQARYSSLCLMKNEKEQKRLTCSCSLIYKVIFLLGAISFLVVGIPLLKIIRPSMIIDYMLIIFVCIFYYLYYQHSLFASMIASSNDIPYYRAFVISSLCSVLLSIMLTKYAGMGIWGLVTAQLVVNLVYNNWKWPFFLLKRLNLRYLDIYTIGVAYIKAGLIK